MGMNLMSNSGCSYTGKNDIQNPNPRNFQIESICIENGWAIVCVKYPDCVNYEGRKILVYEDVTEFEIRNWLVIDPHFCDNEHPSPVARFEPTDRGMRLAVVMCGAT